MTRRKIRENIFKALFCVEFHDQMEFGEQFLLFAQELEGKANEEELAYINHKCDDIMEHLGEIDGAISEKATGWKTSRMGKAELTILRLAVYEIRFEEDIPDRVAINEAVELAKAYGTDDSASFVNGVLAKFA